MFSIAYFISGHELGKVKEMLEAVDYRKKICTTKWLCLFLTTIWLYYERKKRCFSGNSGPDKKNDHTEAVTGVAKSCWNYRRFWHQQAGDCQAY
jgi:hypothetical protein